MTRYFSHLLLSIASILGFSTSPKPAQAATRADGQGCLVHHLEEARALNIARQDIYAAWSQGASRRVSALLIGSERAAIPVAGLLLERHDRILARAGLHILCDDFVSMSLTPPLPPEPLKDPQPLSAFRPHRGWRGWVSIQYWALRGDYERLWREADHRIEELADTPTYHCMYRHMLESIRRAAYLAPQQLAEAQALGHRRRAALLIRKVIGLQVALVPLAFQIDRMAAPVQAQGVPIVCQDVPAIGLN